MIDKKPLGTDPEDFVDDFSNAVEQWRSELEQWEKERLSGSFHPWGVADDFKIKLLGDLDRFLDMQNKVNIMILAALDDLRKS